ncbi:hypothetical protein [Desulfosporosinus metallidurans]|uniref:hypothetical protein n=1 Tax=Desulfosporosinus metallidurans TaxID=1888891 RepID=UPI001F39C2B3|nr:hypothetical protein [Desulfosporosinus metallidurans]
MLQALGKTEGCKIVSIGKAAGQLCFYLIIKLPVCRNDLPAVRLRDIEQVLDGQPGIVILADRQSCRAFIDVSAEFVPYRCGGKHGDVWILRVHQQGVVKAVFIKPCRKTEIIPPCALGSGNVGRDGFIDRPQSFILFQNFTSSQLTGSISTIYPLVRATVVK